MNLHVQHYLPKSIANSLFFFIGIYLLYNIVLVSAVQQSESAICIHMCPPLWTSLPTPIPSTPLGHHRAPCWASCAWYQLPTVSYWYLARMAPNCMWNQEGLKWCGQPAAQAHLLTWFILQPCWLHIYTIRTLVPSFITLQ